MTNQCPYCMGTRLTGVQSLVECGAEELLALGIQVPTTRQCLTCHATLSPRAFTPGTPEYQHSLTEGKAYRARV